MADAVARLLRPLVKLLVHFNITFPTLSNLLKSIYIEVADREFPLDGKRQTDSRITLLTGVHRKDVRRFRQGAGNAEESQQVASLGALLVSQWTGRPDLAGTDGRPLPLPRLPQDEGVSFESFVQSVSKDIRPRVVLDEWLRLGVVRIDDDDRVCLNDEAFVPDVGADEKAFFMGRNLRDHIAACVNNLTGGERPMMERSVFYDELTDADVAELESMTRDLGMQVLRSVNRRALELQKASAGSPDATRRMNFGVYFYHDDGAEEPARPDTHG